MTAAPPVMTVKVTVADTWETHSFDAPPDLTVGALKARALASSRIAADRSGMYEVKFGGGPVRDESRTMSALKVKDGSAFIIISRRRRPVR